MDELKPGIKYLNSLISIQNIEKYDDIEIYLNKYIDLIGKLPKKDNKRKWRLYMPRKSIKSHGQIKIDTEVEIEIMNQWDLYCKDLLEGHLEQLKIAKIAKMDFHGAYISVKKSPILSQVGKKGVVFLDSARILYLSSMGRLIAIPKKGRIFEVKILQKIYFINGDGIVRDTVERSVRKFKPIKLIIN